MIVVSHDRYFLNRVVDLLLVLDGAGNVQVIHGNYDTYEMMRATSPERQRRDDTSPTRQRGPDTNPTRQRADTKPTPPKRKRKYPYRKVPDIEADIAAAETELQQVEQLLASPELYRDGERVKQTTKAFEEIKARLQQLYEHWEEAGELN